MTENTKMGREPLQRLTVEPDKCANTWGVLPCRASLTNYLYNSVSYNNSDRWTITEGGAAVGVGPDPTGGFNAARIVKTTAAAAPLNVVPVDSYSTGEKSSHFYIFSAKEDVNIDLIQYTITTSSDTFVVELDLTNGNATTTSVDQPISLNTADLGSGWYQLAIEVPQSVGPTESLSINGYLAGLVNPANGDAFLFYGHQITDKYPQEYVVTSEGAWISDSTEECFNTASTCQDLENYDPSETFELKFIDPRTPALRDDYYLPYLSQVSISPARINVSGVGRSTSPFGKRSVLTATLTDHPHDDKVVDPYRENRNYNPLERATFWTKWRARNQYYTNRPVKFESGYFANGSLVDGITREFVLTKFSGPNANGIVSIEAKDILSLAEDEKAQAPRQSNGSLLNAINDTQLGLTLTPAGIGDAEYPSTGHIRINREVMYFSRTGDNFSVLRGQKGTTASSHDDGDNAQLCLEYDSENLSDILYDLLLNYADIPDTFLDKTQWDNEVASFQTRLYSTIITQPTGVKKLVSEMVEQMFFNVFYDERDSLVKIRVSRTPQGEEITDVADFGQLLENTIVWTDLPDQLLTQVWVYYGQSDPTDKLDEERNFAAVETGISVTEGANFYNKQKIRKIYSRWLDATNTAGAADLVTNLITRFGNIPRQVAFQLDAKDRDLWLADFAKIANRDRVDIFGQVEIANLQINQVSESELGTKYSYIANEYVPAVQEGDEDPDAIQIPIASDLLNVNLYDLYVDLRGTPNGDETVVFTIRSGVTIGGDSMGGGVNVGASARVTANDFYDAGTATTSGLAIGNVPAIQRAGIVSPRDTAKDATYPGSSNTADFLIKEYPLSVALQTGTWPGGVTLKLIIQSGAFVLGEGGAGSAHNFQESIPSLSIVYECLDGGDGGHALQIDHPIEIDNEGSIYAGAGGGGSVGYATTGIQNGHAISSGGGGAGFVNGRSVTFVNVGDGLLETRSANASSNLSGGDGAILDFDLVPPRTLLAGNGANSPDHGGDGTFDDQFLGIVTTTSNGGIAGDAVASGSGNITWISKGDVKGDEN